MLELIAFIKDLGFSTISLKLQSSGRLKHYLRLSDARITHSRGIREETTSQEVFRLFGPSPHKLQIDSSTSQLKLPKPTQLPQNSQFLIDVVVAYLNTERTIIN